VPYLYERELFEPLHQIDSNVAKWKYIPLYGYTVEDMKFTWIRGLLGFIGIYGGEDYFLGFNPRNRQWSDEFERFKASNPAGVSYPIDPRGVRAFEDLIQVCLSKNIQLILVFSPEYHEMHSLERNRTEIVAMFKEISGRLRVPLWDYSNSPLSQDRANFVNSQHLNANGAKVFSTELAARLVESGLLSQPAH
jgi:hypothetical protein